MRSGDLVSVLGLVRHAGNPAWTVRSLAEELCLPPAAVQRSLARLGETPAYDARRRRLNWSGTEELLTSVVPFVAPARVGPATRGVPTAWAALPLSQEFGAIEELPPVWPAAEGNVRGFAVEPLHAAALDLAGSDPWMYEMLALVDGIRVGDARVRGVARDLLGARLAQAAQT